MSTKPEMPAKPVSNDELALIVTALLLNPSAVGEDMAQPAHDRFRRALATLVADHCGGHVLTPEAAPPSRWTAATVLVEPDEAIPALESNVWSLAWTPDAWLSAASAESGAYASFDPATAARVRAEMLSGAIATVRDLAARAEAEADAYVTVTLMYEDWTEEAYAAGERNETGTVMEDELIPLNELHRWVRDYGTTDRIDPNRLMWRSPTPVEDRAHFEHGRDRFHTLLITHIDGRVPSESDAARIIEALQLPGEPAKPAVTLWSVTLPWHTEDSDDYCTNVWAVDENEAKRRVAIEMHNDPSVDPETDLEEWIAERIEEAGYWCAVRVEDRIASDLGDLLSGPAGDSSLKHLTIGAFLERAKQEPSSTAAPTPSAG